MICINDEDKLREIVPVLGAWQLIPRLSVTDDSTGVIYKQEILLYFILKWGKSDLYMLRSSELAPHDPQ